MRDLRIVFLGTPDFAVGILKTLLDEGKNIVGVVTAPDRQAGRGRKVKFSAVKEFALAHNLPVLQPTNLKNEDFLKKLDALKANLQIIVAFRMLPKVVWAMPEYGTFNLHASLLPEYRGAAPINWAIINREKKTGVTTFFIDEKIDTGEIILSSEIKIAKKETVGTLHDKLMNLGSELVIRTVDEISNGSISTIAQPQTGVLKEAPKLNNENTRINWNSSVKRIDALIRGLSPYPVAWTTLYNGGEELKMKVYKVKRKKAKHELNVGVVITDKKELKVTAKNGFIYIKELQLPGKRKMAVSDLLNGYSFEEGAKVL